MRVFLSILLASWFAAQAGLASDECNVRRIADVVKTISILRQVENSFKRPGTGTGRCDRGYLDGRAHVGTIQ